MGKNRGDVGVQRTLCVNGNGGREKGSGEVGARRRNGGTLVRRLLQRGFVPGGEFEGIEVVNGGEGEEFVQRWYHIVVLDIGQTADMEDEIAPPAIHGNLKTGSLDVAIAKAEPLALAT
jgi:hypothetical protein